MTCYLGDRAGAGLAFPSTGAQSTTCGHPVAPLYLPVRELITSPESAPLDLEKLFGRAAPLEIDLGCGDGVFLAALAEQHPERNFLGIERMVGRLHGACRRAIEKNLANVRLLRAENQSALRDFVPANSVSVIHLLFPDPWPKRRHHRRRLVTEDFLATAYRVLAVQGVLCVTTDAADYFAQIMRLCLVMPEFAPDAGAIVTHLPETTFEKKFKQAGSAIHRLVLRKVSF